MQVAGASVKEGLVRAHKLLLLEASNQLKCSVVGKQLTANCHSCFANAGCLKEGVSEEERGSALDLGHPDLRTSCLFANLRVGLE